MEASERAFGLLLLVYCCNAVVVLLLQRQVVVLLLLHYCYSVILLFCYLLGMLREVVPDYSCLKPSRAPHLLLTRQGAHKSQQPGSSASQESAYGTVREGDTWGGVIGLVLFAGAHIFRYRWYSHVSWR